MHKALFIVFEGIDGSGTTTQADHLCRHIEGLGFGVVRTREPGGTPLAERIRQLLLDPMQAPCAAAEMLLYAAARAQLVAEVIAPALRAGSPVVSDRFIASSLAYQGVGRRLGLEAVWEANRHAVAGVLPDLTVYLDVSVGVARLRRQARGEPPDRIELAGDDLQRQVAEGYRLLAARDPASWLPLDASAPGDVVAEDVRQAVHSRWPSFPYGD